MSQKTSKATVEKCSCPSNFPILKGLREMESSYSSQSQRNIRAVVTKAIYSVKRFPLPIEKHEDALSLDGVGPYLASEIMKIVKKSSNISSSSEIEEIFAADKTYHGGDIGLEENSGKKHDGSDHFPGTFSISSNITRNCMESANVTRKTKSKETVHDRSVSFSSGMWEAVLIIDMREKDAEKSQAYMMQNGVCCEIRTLPLGDMLWIARRLDNASDEKNKEFLLGYIVERKTASDLASSIIDGRFNEQKHRMLNSNLSHVTYLIEGSISNEKRILPVALRTAIVNTQVLDGFTVIWTENLSESLVHLKHIHKQIELNLKFSCGNSISTLGTKLTPVMSFDQYKSQCLKGKDPNIKHIFGSQLRQIHGCSADRAAAILEKYPTPLDLVLALEAEGSFEGGIAMLAGVSLEKGRLNKPLQEAICRLYYCDHYT